jgi:4-amino-4-deoxy-L-arabinose transferase-like glycosyltransferase
VRPRTLPPRLRGWLELLEGRAGLVIAVAAGVGLRLAYVVAVAGTRLSDDETSFWAIAGNVAHGRGYTYLGKATAWRPPLYTGLLAGARWLGASIRDVQLVQAVVGAATVALLFAATRELTHSRRAAILAAWVGAVYPPFVYFAGRMLSENVAIPLYVLALWVSVIWLERRGATWAALCGLSWGAAILGRPTALPVAALCVVIGGIGVSTSRRGARAIVEAGLVLLVIAAVMAPWVARNASSVGGPEPITSNEGFALWSANRLDDSQLKSVNDDVRYPGMQDYAVYGRAFPGIEPLARAKGFDFDTASEASQDDFFRKLATHDIESDPLRFVTRTAERAVFVLLPAPDNASQTAKTGRVAKVVLWVTSGPLMVLGIIGLAVLTLRERRNAIAWFLTLSAVGSLLLVATHVPDVRYRVDGVDPILVISGSWLVVEGLRRRGAAPPTVAPSRASPARLVPVTP